METKIIKTLKEWAPVVPIEEATTNDYELLHTLADFCLETFRKEDADNADALEVVKVVNILYLNGPLHDRNAIENEFLSVLASEDAPGSLKRHMQLLPKELRQVYLKTILEN